MTSILEKIKDQLGLKSNMLKKIERQLGFKLPEELKILYELIDAQPDSTYVIDIAKSPPHWFLDAKYFLLNSKNVRSSNDGSFAFPNRMASEGENILLKANEKISYSMSSNWKEHKSFTFAWTNELPEQDTGLAYVFEKNGTVKGIYAHSLNWVEDKVFVANKLTDIIDFDEIRSNSGIVNLTNLLNINQKTFAELLADSHQIIDLESVDDVKDYAYLLKIFEQLSNGEFSPSAIGFSEENRVRVIEFELEGKLYSANLEGDTDYVDLNIVSFINNCLADQNKNQRHFVAFNTVSFGTEAGLAFVTPSELDELQKLSGVTILKS
ncbi:hypothetical protein [Sessilibacter sp. MAH4]